MAYPGAERIELPILQELVATGGADDVRFLYERLISYFPQISDEETRAQGDIQPRNWRRLVQRAGLALDEKRQIDRERGFWTITKKGRERVSAEGLEISLVAHDEKQYINAKGESETAHADIQRIISEIGRTLGYHTQLEFEYYDVVWRANAESLRLSHVFEVQNKGNVDAALAKLKRAYDSQRSKPFLVVTSERDTTRAKRNLSHASAGAFHEIGQVTTILSFEQLRKLHRALTSVEDVLGSLFER